VNGNAAVDGGGERNRKRLLGFYGAMAFIVNLLVG